MDGKYIETLTGYGLPANADSYENLLLIPELHARVTLLNEKNEVVARLGPDGRDVVPALLEAMTEKEAILRVPAGDLTQLRPQLEPHRFEPAAQVLQRGFRPHLQQRTAAAKSK